MDKKTITTMKKTFDDIMHTTEDGSVEFWYARELMECLGYATWRRFKEAIERAKESCKRIRQVTTEVILFCWS